MADDTITVNRAPVLTLWAAVVAERLGYDEDEALSLAKAVASLNAQAKGRRLGIYDAPEEGDEKPEPRRAEDEIRVDLLGRPIPAVRTKAGVRAVSGEKPIAAEPVRRYLHGKFGDDLGRVRAAMAKLAATYAPEELETRAYRLYESFRPQIDPGKRGWGQAGKLDLDRIRSLADQGSAGS